MITWFANHPWSIIWVIVAVIVVLVVLFGTSGRLKYLAWIAGLVVLAALVLSIASLIDTDVKQIDHSLDAIAHDLITHQIAAAMDLVAPDYKFGGEDFQTLRSHAERWADRLTLEKITLSDRQISVAPGAPDQATSRFTETARGQWNGTPFGHIAQWDLRWHKTGGKWRIVEIHYIMPGRGETAIP